MAHTMADELALAPDKKSAAVIKTILEAGEVLDKLPVQTVDSLEVDQLRWSEIPAVAFRLPNEGFGEGTGKVERVSYGIAIIGHEIDSDIIYEKTKHNVKPRTLYTEQTLESINYTINDTILNGDKASDPRSFDGLKKISTALPSRQLVDRNPGASSATTLDLRNGGVDSATRQSFFDRFNRAKRVVRGGKPDLAVANENVIDLVDAMLRREGLYKDTQDKFERTVMVIKGIPLVDAGYKDMDGDELILANDHDVPDAGTKETSIYLLKLDSKRDVGLLQLHSISTRDLGELQTKPVRRTRIDWALGIAVWGKHSLARMNKLQVAS